MPEPTAPRDPALARWLALVNAPENAAQARDVCSADVVVHAWPSGRGGRREVFVGSDAVEEWIRRVPPERFRFTVVRETEGLPSWDLPPEELAGEQLPSGERAVTVRYRIEHLTEDFSNEGDWLLYATGDRMVALLHLPDPLPSEEA